MANDDLTQGVIAKQGLRIARALTWRYGIALALVASLSTAAWLSMHLVIIEQESTAAVVNVSGRQRMLSQRTALFSNLLFTTSKADRPLVRSKLKEAIALMARSHHGLIKGDKEMGLPGTLSPTVRAMYFDGPKPLDSEVNAYIKTVEALLQEDDGALTPDNPLLKYINDTAQAPLLKALDQMVKQYQREGEASVKRLERIETIFWLVTLLLLMMEAALIFHPFIRHIRSVVGKLQDVTEELKLHKDNLEGMVRHRTSELESRSKELAESEEKFRLISTSAKDGIVIIGTDEQVIYWNPAAEQIFGYRADEIIGKNLHTILTPSLQRDAAHMGFKKFQDSGEGAFVGKTFEITAQHKCGIEFPIELSISAIRINNSWHALGIARDITERKKVEADLRIAATAFEAQEGMLVTDSAGLVLKVNSAFTRITGYSADDIKGKSPSLLNSGRQDSNFYHAMWDSLDKNGAWEGEIWNRRKSGEVYPEYLSISSVKDSNGTVTNYVATFSDITLNKAAEDEIKNLAFFDPLTLLPNRRLLLDRLRQALTLSARSGHEGALLFIDLDNFKTLNDTLGHDFGDLLLQQVADRLTTCVRKGDTVARLGGDEFVVILEELSRTELEAAAQAEVIGTKIMTSLNEPYQLASKNHRSTPSIGVTLFKGQDASLDELMKQADIAMYQAKKSGRNAIRFFDPEMQAGLTVRASLEQELSHALEGRQFELYYQIQVDNLFHAVGAEALIRWTHPEHGLVSPASFIPIAEEVGLIVPMGQFVLEQACFQIKAWQQDALTRHLTLAVNVSAKQFRQAGFIDQVELAIRSHSIDPTRLKLELTESILLENIDDTIAKMNMLRELGVRFSLDDFGTGYSSLQYLKKLPLDQLKIDQSFVRNITSDSSDSAIVTAIIDMAKNLELDVIAEGVETEEQRQFLLDKGCMHFQGYLFSKPVTIEQFEALVRKQ